MAGSSGRTDSSARSGTRRREDDAHREDRGKEEVERIRDRYAIEIGSNGDYIGDTFLRFVRRAGERHAAAARACPAPFPGSAMATTNVWGGRLAQGPLGS